MAIQITTMWCFSVLRYLYYYLSLRHFHISNRHIYIRALLTLGDIMTTNGKTNCGLIPENYYLSCQDSVIKWNEMVSAYAKTRHTIVQTLVIYHCYFSMWSKYLSKLFLPAICQATSNNIICPNICLHEYNYGNVCIVQWTLANIVVLVNRQKHHISTQIDRHLCVCG